MNLELDAVESYLDLELDAVESYCGTWTRLGSLEVEFGVDLDAEGAVWIDLGRYCLYSWYPQVKKRSPWMS